METSKSYSLADVVSHNNKTDCWMVIEDKVYDVTSCISSGSHPGREAIIKGCGKDVTNLFAGSDRGRPHSPKAQSILLDFYIGGLKS